MDYGGRPYGIIIFSLFGNILFRTGKGNGETRTQKRDEFFFVLEK